MTKPVVILVRAPVVAAGVEHLLSSAEDLTLVKLPNDADVNLCAEIARLRPNVLIIDSESAFRAVVPLLIGLDPCADLRILCVLDKANLVCVFDRQVVSLEQAADFLDAVCGPAAHGLQPHGTGLA